MNSLESDLARIRANNPIFAGRLLVLEKNENSDLLPRANESSQEFFESVFGMQGPYWSVLQENGFAVSPHQCNYVQFVANQPFFLKNVEQRFLLLPGMQKQFVVKNNEIIEKMEWNASSLLFLLSGPSDFFRQTANLSPLAFRQKEFFSDFGAVLQEADSFWSANQTGFQNPLAIAQTAHQKAVEAMRFSFVASLAFSLGINTLPAGVPCELEELQRAFQKKNSKQELEERFGFFSNYPYDLSAPRLPELGSRISIAIPTDSLMRWRENAKLACARYLDVERKALLQIGREKGLKENVFHLRLKEMAGNPDWTQLKKLAEQRKKRFEENQSIELPRQLALAANGTLAIPLPETILQKKIPTSTPTGQFFELVGTPVGGPRFASGKAVWVESEGDLAKNIHGAVLVAKTLFPELTLAYKQVAGVASATGGKLAHAAIIAREYDLPCIVQVQGLSKIKEGDWLEVNGKTGKILVWPSQ